jgi:VanZ family protein
MALIFYASSLSDPGAPPGGISDKTAHLLAYFPLGAALVRALAGGRALRMTTPRVAAATIVATLYGVSDELHQMLVPPRTPDWHDVVADCVGALAGAAAFALAARVATRRSADDEAPAVHQGTRRAQGARRHD